MKRFPRDWQRGVEKTLSELDLRCRQQFLKEVRELVELHESGQAEVEKHAKKTRPVLVARVNQLWAPLRKAQRAAEQLFTESLDRQMEALGAPASLKLSDAIEIAKGRAILADTQVADEYQRTSKEINDSFQDWVLEKTWAQAGNEPVPPKPEVDERLTARNARALQQLLITPRIWSAEREMYQFATAALAFLDKWKASHAKGTTMPGYRASLNRQLFHLWCRYHGESIYDEPGLDPKRPNTPTLRTDVPQTYRKFVEAMNAAAGLKLSVSAIEKSKERRAKKSRSASCSGNSGRPQKLR